MRCHPVKVESVEDAVALDVGWAQACALLADATIRCWGANHQGQLGNGTISEIDPYDELPVDVVGISTAVAIASGGHHTCALLDDGRAMCWGMNNAGQLGRGDEPGVGEHGQDFPTPGEVLGLTGATAISASPYAHTCALLAHGSATCWGINDYGELGDGGAIGEGIAFVPIAVVDFDIDQPAP